ncbi:MAG: effector immunity protein Tgi2PP [Acidobacteriota bacterium]
MHRRFHPLYAFLAAVVAAAPLHAAAAQAAHAITPREAHQIAVLVARHDDIDLSDTHIELNSMDMGGDFTPGFYSFILIRESTSPGPDETLRRYAISRRTGDVWEMTLCRHYAFPELTHLQRRFSGRAVTDPAELSAQGKRLGCTQQGPHPTS